MSWVWLGLLAKRVGFFFLDNWKAVLLGIAGLVVLIWVVGFFRDCGKGKPECDEKCLQEINTAIDQKRDAAIEKVLIDNGLVEASVNDRTAESEAKIKAAQEAVAKAKETKGNVTAEELEKILLGETQ